MRVKQLFHFLLYWFTITITYLYTKLFLRHRVFGLTNLPRGGALVTPTHSSYLDPPLVSSSIPEEVHFLGKKALFINPLFGALIRALNTHPIAAGEAGAFRTTIRLVAEGKKVIFFPEGQRGAEDEISELREGIGLLAEQCKAPIIPVYVHGSFHVWNARRKLPRLFGRTACVIGKPLHWDKEASGRDAQRAFALRLREALLALKHWYESGRQGVPP